MIPELTCTYQGVRNVSFSENSAYVLNGWFLIDSRFWEISNTIIMNFKFTKIELSLNFKKLCWGLKMTQGTYLCIFS